VCATALEDPTIICTKEYQASENENFPSSLKIKPRNPYNLHYPTLTFPDLFLHEGGWHQFQQSTNTLALLWHAGDTSSQTCSWL